ncbi:MAG TPA: histidinol-phosphatase [Gaiellaceae bacterium]|jgi:histidinol-phosphatase (PHP family)
MIVDYHMHLREDGQRVSHRVETVERWVEAANGRGVDEIGFTEHIYYFLETRPLWTVRYHLEHCHVSIESYVDAVLEAKRRGLKVKLGVEVDYLPDREEETLELLAPYPWDFILGSIHYLDGLGIDTEPSLVGAVGPERAYRLYFDMLGRAARSGLFDSLAHPDLIKFFGGVIGWDHEAFVAELDGICLEVSTAGLRKPHGRMYPEADLLAAAHRAGVPVTLASDAHEPDDVGRDLARGAAHARAAGYETVTVFEGRRARQEPLG